MEQRSAQTPRNVLITGATGMIGSALRQELEKSGYRVYALARNDCAGPFYYLQDSGVVHLDPSIPLHGVINLAGANISEGRWSAERKQQIMDSRRVTTRLLCEALVAMPRQPRVLLSASAIGYYGANNDSEVDENSAPGEDFLARVAIEWERATAAAQQKGIRTVLLRFGLVLSPNGGVLKNLILPFRLAVVGRIGSGRQFLSWISLDDALQVVMHALEDDTLSGPINLVSNQAVTNADFSRSLARALHRLPLPPLPTFVVRLMFGEMADAALLASARVKSVRLQQAGIKLQHPSLDRALVDLLAR